MFANRLNCLIKMKVFLRQSKFFFLTSAIFSVSVIYYLFKIAKNKVIRKNNTPFTEVLFFSEKNALCFNHGIYDSDCKSDDCGLKKLKQIASYLESATTSLDICVFMITSIKLAEAIVHKFKEGVKVRIITDKTMSVSDGSQIQLFRKNGIFVRTNGKNKSIMHHKFAIVDQTLLINGSLNWTQQGTFGNYENVTITTVPKCLIRSYSDYFEELWVVMDQD